jgi:hypothetical protein
MENEATPEQRAAYKEWLLADEAALDARDAVLAAIHVDEGLIDLDAVERLSARANELRMHADRTPQGALAAVSREDQEPAQLGEDTTTRCASMIRAIVDMRSTRSAAAVPSDIRIVRFAALTHNTPPALQRLSLIAGMRRLDGRIFDSRDGKCCRPARRTP